MCFLDLAFLSELWFAFCNCYCLLVQRCSWGLSPLIHPFVPNRMPRLSEPLKEWQSFLMKNGHPTCTEVLQKHGQLEKVYLQRVKVVLVKQDIIN